MGVRIGFICPSYNNFDYALRTIQSFFKHTPGGYCIFLDDCSPYWTPEWQSKFASALPTPRGDQGMYILRFATWGGLTRSWNYGLKIALEQQLDFCVAGNNDILFTEGWQDGLLASLAHGYRLVGPVSNAAGVSSDGKADVWRYLSEYHLTDDPAYLNAVAQELRSKFAGVVVDTKINGFFMMAKTADWWDGAYNYADGHVFCPRNDFTSKGKPNATPLMTLNEDELQGRWMAKGWKTAVVPSSFIFHYRAVSRGPRYCKGRWYRMPDPQRDV